MSRQHSKPYLVTTTASYPLETAEGAFNELWLQTFVFEHSEALPMPNDAAGHLVLPRVVAQKVEIERAVVRIIDGRIIAESTSEPPTKPGTAVARTKISEQVFYEKLAEMDPLTSNKLRTFLDKAKQ